MRSLDWNHNKSLFHKWRGKWPQNFKYFVCMPPSRINNLQWQLYIKAFVLYRECIILSPLMWDQCFHRTLCSIMLQQWRSSSMLLQQSSCFCWSFLSDKPMSPVCSSQALLVTLPPGPQRSRSFWNRPWRRTQSPHLRGGRKSLLLSQDGTRKTVWSGTR